MHITIALVPVEYRDGMVFQPIPSKPITTHSFEAITAVGIIDALDRMHADYNDGTRDAKVIILSTSGRKVPGFDKLVKPHARNLYCHRNPIWDKV